MSDADLRARIVELEQALSVERAAHRRTRERLAVAQKRSELLEEGLRRAYRFVANGVRADQIGMGPIAQHSEG